jgi:predicted dehydrogenase
MHFGHGRLQALINANDLDAVAVVDLDEDGARQSIASLSGDVPAYLSDRIYTSIGEAKAAHDAEACLIYASTTAHASLITDSLGLGLHTLCVKPVVTSQDELRQVMAAHRKAGDRMLVQGQNKRWNPAASKMREWLQEDGGIGEMLGGECRFWIRQNLWTGPDTMQPDAFVEGLFFHAGSSHQLDQLVAAKGLPQYVTARVHTRTDESLAQTGVWGTAGGQALMEYANGAPFSYTGTRAGHSTHVGWSGSWSFHGVDGDLRRDAGHLELHKSGDLVESLDLQDLHAGLIEDDRIQFDAFAAAIKTGEGREWMETSSVNTWVLMEALNVAAREERRVDVQEFRQGLFG